MVLNLTPVACKELSSNDEDDVMDIKAIYKIPALKHAFLIVSSFDEFFEDSELIQESKTRTEYFERILHSKHCKQPKEVPRWTLKVMSHTDFVSALKRQNPKGQELSNQSSCEHPELELLAINLTKNSSGREKKELSFIDDADIIEVFI